MFTASAHKRGNFGERMEHLEAELAASRAQSRSLLNRLVLLSSSIVGFSATLFSIDAIKSTISVVLLERSWYAFLMVIVGALFCLFFESRVIYAALWRERGLGLSGTTSISASFSTYIRAVVILTVALLIPENKIYGAYKDEDRKDQWLRAHSLVIGWLKNLEILTFVLEDLVLICFVAALYLLVRAVV